MAAAEDGISSWQPPMRRGRAARADRADWLQGPTPTAGRSCSEPRSQFTPTRADRADARIRMTATLARWRGDARRRLAATAISSFGRRGDPRSPVFGTRGAQHEVGVRREGFAACYALVDARREQCASTLLLGGIRTRATSRMTPAQRPPRRVGVTAIDDVLRATAEPSPVGPAWSAAAPPRNETSSRARSAEGALGSGARARSTIGNPPHVRGAEGDDPWRAAAPLRADFAAIPQPSRGAAPTTTGRRCAVLVAADTRRSSTAACRTIAQRRRGDAPRPPRGARAMASSRRLERGRAAAALVATPTAALRGALARLGREDVADGTTSPSASPSFGAAVLDYANEARPSASRSRGFVERRRPRPSPSTRRPLAASSRPPPASLRAGSSSERSVRARRACRLQLGRPATTRCADAATTRASATSAPMRAGRSSCSASELGRRAVATSRRGRDACSSPWRASRRAIRAASACRLGHRRTARRASRARLRSEPRANSRRELAAVALASGCSWRGFARRAQAPRGTTAHGAGWRAVPGWPRRRKSDGEISWPVGDRRVASVAPYAYRVADPSS